MSTEAIEIIRKEGLSIPVRAFQIGKQSQIPEQSLSSQVQTHIMVKIEIEMDPSQFFKKSIFTFKNNRTLQFFSVLILLLLISKPVHSMYVDFTTPANAHERDNKYVIMEVSGGYIYLFEDSEVVFSDQETLSLTIDGSEFPSDVTITSVSVHFFVADNDGDNEDTTGLGCAFDNGEDASDSISVFADHPSIDSQSTVSEWHGGLDLVVFETPELDTYPFITGYTVDEIEEMYDTSEVVKGEYSFNFTGFVEAGESTTECERSDSSVTFEYTITVSFVEIKVVECNQLMMLLGCDILL